MKTADEPDELQYDPVDGTLYSASQKGGHTITTIPTFTPNPTATVRYSNGQAIVVLLLDTTTTLPAGKFSIFLNDKWIDRAYDFDKSCL